MRLLNEQDFRSLKKSDTLVIYGSGYSISKLNTDDIQKLSQFDSISFNWFLKSNIPTTFYIVREQANLARRVNKASGETVEAFYDMINSKNYVNSCLIIHDIYHHSKKSRASEKVYHYSKPEALAKFNRHKYIIVKDLKRKHLDSGVRKWGKINICEQGVVHGRFTLNSALHIGVNMGYNRIIFVGVDLYDSRYFWLDKNVTRYTVKQKNQRYSSKHATADRVLELIKEIKSIHKLKMYVYSRSSLLTKVMKKWQW